MRIQFFKKILLTQFPLIVFMLLYLLFSFATFRHYGNTWDEFDVYSRGSKLFNHLVEGKTDTQLIVKNDPADGNVLYNHIYASTLIPFNENKSYEKFHLLNLLFSSFLFIFAYQVLLHFFKKPQLAILGPIFLFLTPRFIGDIPGNPKDGPFAIVYFSALCIIYFSRSIKSGYLKVLLLGILFGLSQSMRILGFTLYFIFIFSEIVSIFETKDYRKNLFSILGEQVLQLICITIIAFSVMTFTWPYLGSNIYHNFLDVLDSSKNFPWAGDVLFLGKYVNSTELPFTYLPIWILVTTPAYIILLIISLFLNLKFFIKQRIFQIFFSALVINLLFYLILKPIIYDGLRHFLFLLPIITFLATISCIKLVESLTIEKNQSRKRIIQIFSLVILLFMSLTALKFVKLHPYQYTYFNEFFSQKKALELFEGDYWLASYKEAYKWLEVNKFQKGRQYKVFSCNYDYEINNTKNYLPGIAVPSNSNEAEFIICNTRWNLHKNYFDKELLHVIKRMEGEYTYIYKN